MSILLPVLVYVALFAMAWWSGRTLARHHGDGWEVGAVAALGVVVLGAVWLAQATAGAVPALGLAGAGGGGLFLGYIRAEPTD